MEVEFLGQPYRNWTSAGSFLAKGIADPAVRHVTIVTAWVRRSGMLELIPSLEELRARGGKTEMVVGVDLKVTTRQGLELAHRHTSPLHVVHDPEMRTFHPKLYLATGGDRAYALIGSNNLTAGGMGFNYEGCVALTFDPRREPALVSDLRAYRRRLLADTAVCRKVTRPVLQQLVDERWLSDEDSDRHRNEDRPGGARNKGKTGKPPLFRRSAVDKRRTKPPPRKRSKKQRPRKSEAAAAVAPDAWWKQLSRSDAQRPPRGSATRAVRLTPPRGAPDRALFFRKVFFGEGEWRRTRDSQVNLIYLADVAMDTWIDGRSFGEKLLTVDYGPHRDERGRATTDLRWGELLPYVQENDLTGRYILIERAHGSYRLTITAEKPA